MGPTGDENEETMPRRLLQGLEERVGGADRQAVRIVDEADFPLTDERSIDELLFDLPHLLDLDLRRRCVAIRLDDEVIRVRPGDYLQTRSATATTVLKPRRRGLLAVESLSEPHRRHQLSDPGLTIEQIRMGQSPVAQRRLKD